MVMLALLFAIYKYNGMWVLLVGLVGCCLCVLDWLTLGWSGFFRGMEGLRTMKCFL